MNPCPIFQGCDAWDSSGTSVSLSLAFLSMFKPSINLATDGLSRYHGDIMGDIMGYPIFWYVIYIYCIGWRCFWWKMMINRGTGVGFSSLRQSQIDNGEWYRSQYRKILQECTRRSMDHVHSMDHLAHHDVFSCNSFGAAREDSCPFWDSWDTLSAVVFHVSLHCSS